MQVEPVHDFDEGDPVFVLVMVEKAKPGARKVTLRFPDGTLARVDKKVQTAYRQV